MQGVPEGHPPCIKDRLRTALATVKLPSVSSQPPSVTLQPSN